MLPRVDRVDRGDLEGQGAAVVSTLVEVLRPRYGFIEMVDGAGALRVPVEELGRVQAQPGEPHRLRDQLAIAPVAWTPGAFPEGARSIPTVRRPCPATSVSARS